MKKKVLLEIAILLIIGLLPLLWMPADTVVLGHDAGLPLEPIGHFFDRLFSWSRRLGFGVDQSLYLAGFFIHGLEALVYSATNSLHLMQNITFVFWFTLPGLCMYGFASEIERRLRITYFALFASVFYMVNHFLLQGWFVAERTKFSVYAAIPLVLLFLNKWEQKSWSSFRTAISISLVLFVLNGGGSLPLFGGLFVVLGVYGGFYIYEHGLRSGIWQLLVLAFITGVSSVLLHAYWLVPLFDFLGSNFGAQVALAGGSSGVSGWISYISQESSFINLFRLQGIPEWYQNPSHPYANVFLGNPVLIVVSGFLPVLAFLPLYAYRNKREIMRFGVFVASITLVSMIFVAGYHPPFDLIYRLMIKFVPGFIAFRTPYYKFASGLWLGYSLLLALGVQYLITRFVRRNALTIMAYIVCIAGVVGYSYPFLNGIFFDYVQGERSMRVEVPEYIYEFGSWSETEERKQKRTLALPPPNPYFSVDTYGWGYWSLSPLTSLLTRSSILNKSDYFNRDQQELIEQLYQMILTDDPGWISLAGFMGIDSFVVRKDFLWNGSSHATEDPRIYEEVLIRNPYTEYVKSFGEWVVYDIIDIQSRSHISAQTHFDVLYGKPADLAKLAGLGVLRPNDAIFVSSSVTTPSQETLNSAEMITLVPRCLRCDLQRSFVDFDRYQPIITQGSVFYSAVDWYRTVSGKSIKSMEQQLYNSLTNLLGLKKVIDEKKSESEIGQSIDSYVRSLELFSHALEEYLIETNGGVNGFLLEAENVLVAQKQKLLGEISPDINNIQHVSDLNVGYAYLESSLQKTRANYWVTDSLENKRYELEVPKTGLYTMYLRTDDVEEFSTIDHVKIDNDVRNVHREIEHVGWIDYGEYQLQEGRSEIELAIQPKYISALPESLLFESEPDGVCTTSDSISGRLGEVYRITLSHKKISGDGHLYARIIRSESDIMKLNTSGDTIESTYFFKEYKNDYKIQSRTETFAVQICNYPYVDEYNDGFSIELNDIGIVRLTVPDILFVQNPDRVESSIHLEESEMSQVEFVASGDISDKTVVVLDEGYSSKWVLNGGDTAPMEINGFQTGWIIGGKTDSIEIVYKSQRYIMIGAAITLLSLTALVTVGLLRRLK